MKRGGAYLLLSLLALLIGLRIFAPGYAAEARRKISDLLNGSEDYGQMVQTLGRDLSNGALREELVEAFQEINSFDNGKSDEESEKSPERNSSEGPEDKP